MTVSIHCPNCQHQARCGADKIGKQVRCPSCSEVFTISVPGASVRAAAEARRRRADPAPERTRRPGAHANRTPRRSNKRGRSSVGTAVAIVAVLLACGSGLAYALSAGNADTNLAPRLPA
ncbi:MAG: hypothetical protein PF961_06960, partial [Planctomycetota bacterium]|nr:hypothetical protein [Planctomycetota bacterium]